MSPQQHRLQTIEQARNQVLQNQAPASHSIQNPKELIAPWVLRSWQRCLQQELRPNHKPFFNPVSQAQIKRIQADNHHLIQAAMPVLESLSHTLAKTRYFAVLTNPMGDVIAAHGPIDQSDPAAERITRVGVNLSEAAIGTSAIGSALIEQQTVWLHRGEHFFNETSLYSCAGAPLYGSKGECVGMLDLTGIMAEERRELCHLVEQAAGNIQNQLVLAVPHQVVLRFNWPGQSLMNSQDAIVCLDSAGFIQSSNKQARHMLGLDAFQTQNHSESPHFQDLFATDQACVMDAATQDMQLLCLPLWSGLCVDAVALLPHQHTQQLTSPTYAKLQPITRATLVPEQAKAQQGLKEVESELIAKTLRQLKGNVAQTAKVLGISRATIYRKLK